MKIAKLAVADEFRQKYRWLDSFMVYQARRFARFRTVDADIEHDEGVSAFYEKLGFSPNIELSARKRKTISMRADVDWLHLV